jgi:hypothetical protein
MYSCRVATPMPDARVAEASQPCGERRGTRSDVWKALYLLGRNAQTLRTDLAEVSQLRIDDRHGLFAEAAECLLVFLGDPTNPLGAHIVGAGQAVREPCWLRWHGLPL